MKPDSSNGGNGNSDEGNMSSTMKTLASAINVTGDVDRDFDMDDEVMNFMHSHIHKQLLRLTNNDACQNKQGMMDGDTKAYFDEVIRGSALFGLLPDNEGELDEGDKENNEFFFSDQVTDNDHNQSEETQDNTAKFQLSRLLLAKKVAEAFMLNRSDRDNNEGEVDTSVSASGTTSSLNWGARLMKGKENCLHADDCTDNNSGSVSRQSEYSIETDLQAERDRLLEEDTASVLAMRLEAELEGSIIALWQQRLNQSSSCEGDIDIEYASDVNSTGPPSPRGGDASGMVTPAELASSNIHGKTDDNANRSSGSTTPVKTPFSLPSESSSSTALDEIRARLRKTQFDYTSDSGQRVTEVKPQFDFRNVLKKKDKE